MSALPPKADISVQQRCPLWANSGQDGLIFFGRHWRRGWLGRLDDEVGKQSCNAIMDSFSCIKFIRRREKVECTEFRPQFHNTKPVKQTELHAAVQPSACFLGRPKARSLMQFGDYIAYSLKITSAPAAVGGFNTLVEGGAKCFRIDPLHRIDHSGLPDDQVRLGGGQVLRDGPQRFRSSPPGFRIHGHLDGDVGQFLRKHILEARRISLRFASRREASRTRPQAPEYRAAWPSSALLARGNGKGFWTRCSATRHSAGSSARASPASVSSTSMIVPNSLMPRSQQTMVSRAGGRGPGAPDVPRFYTMKSLSPPRRDAHGVNL